MNYLKKNYFLSPQIFTLFIGIFLIFSSCKRGNNEDITFFGGKIKNPRGKYVYLYDGRKVIDSAKINKDSRFSFHLDSVKLGLYTFKHGPEYQYLYLEPKDSLLIYLNTWDFDESLIFSGRGSARNNYLINLYLEQEKNQQLFKHKYDLDEKQFSELIDKGIQKQLITYNELLESEEEHSEFFNKLAHTGIYFPFYYFKELYPFNHKRKLQLKHFPKLSKSFYSYRKDLNLNDESLLNYDPYTTYIVTYFYHKAYAEMINNPKNDNIELNYMKLVSDNIKNQTLKDELLASSLWKSLTNTWLEETDCKNVQDYFFANCANEKLKKEIKHAIFQKERLNKGDTLPNIMAIDFNGRDIKIKEITNNKNTVIYFWPTDLKRVELVIENLHKLERNFPNIKFIGIERNKSVKNWKKFVKNKKLNNSSQFLILKNTENYNLFSGDMARTLLIDKDGYIKNGYLFFTDKYIAMHVKDLNN